MTITKKVLWLLFSLKGRATQKHHILFVVGYLGFFLIPFAVLVAVFAPDPFPQPLGKILAVIYIPLSMWIAFAFLVKRLNKFD